MIEKDKLILFNAIEGGSKFWCDELRRLGSATLVERILADDYLNQRKSVERIKDRILNSSFDNLQQQISRCGARFITSESLEWPKALNDLVSATRTL